MLCKSSAAGPENFTELEHRPLTKNIMFQASYAVDKLFNRTVSWYIDRLDIGVCRIRSLKGLIEGSVEAYLHTCFTIKKIEKHLLF